MTGSRQYLICLANRYNIIFAGKAHPNDKGGQDLIRMIVETSHRPEFLGKIIFLQDYDMNLAKALVQGADVWLNTPTRPLEASGTSGQKAVLNGTLHFSVLDGWWVEGYQPGAGWALSNENAYQTRPFRTIWMLKLFTQYWNRKYFQPSMT